MQPRLIAEYKRRSPFDGEITSYTLREMVMRYDVDPKVLAISIVADINWGGCLDDVREARELTTKPILAKIGKSEERNMPAFGEHAIQAGATWYLTHDWVVAADDPARAWLEMHTESDFPPNLESLPLVVLLNNRNIHTGELTEAANALVPLLVGKKTMICVASGYKSLREAPPVAHFCLIGTAFLK